MQYENVSKLSRKVHPKLTKEHTLIDINDFLKHQTDQEQNTDMTKIQCVKHLEQCCCSFCVICDELVCQSRISKFHKNHSMTGISNTFHEKIKILKTKKIV